MIDNVAFPLRMRGVPRGARRARALAALARVSLDHLAERPPGTLSGGQQQRVALARAVVAEPPLVLFDEPLSNLDRELRDELAVEIARLMRELGLSGIYVTHDQAEAFAVADRVAVVVDGAIAQIGPPEALVAEPATLAVARFLDLGEVEEGRLAAGRFEAPGLSLAAASLGGAPAEGPACLLVPRPALRPGEDGPLRARVLRCRFQGERYRLDLELEGGTRLACASDRRARPGEAVRLALEPRRARLFPAANHPEGDPA